MLRRVVFCLILLGFSVVSSFAQVSAIRDYVGLINQSFHPDVESYMNKLSDDLQKRGYTKAVKNVENYLKGDSGSGFIYVAKDGSNYIITNFHVISQAQTDGLSVTFEKPDGEKTKFSNLSIVYADEDMDIALLAFSGGHKPFSQGLAFLNRPVNDGDDVYSAPIAAQPKILNMPISETLSFSRQIFLMI